MLLGARKGTVDIVRHVGKLCNAGSVTESLQGRGVEGPGKP